MFIGQLASNGKLANKSVRKRLGLRFEADVLKNEEEQDDDAHRSSVFEQ
jgi:hypothetical protein